VIPIAVRFWAHAEVATAADYVDRIAARPGVELEQVEHGIIVRASGQKPRLHPWERIQHVDYDDEPVRDTEPAPKYEAPAYTPKRGRPR
jgi:cytidylate kinase